MFKYLISIHDVMPETLDRVEWIIDQYFELDQIAPDLLIVPGKNWKTNEIVKIRDWANKGCELVAHGWVHHVSNYENIYHRIHSILISRNVAEHLSLKSSEILNLMVNSKRWFTDNNLPEPKYYVPPAWALGFISRKDLAQLPYDKVEVLRGFITPETNKLERSPVVGYEADTAFRMIALKAFNKCSIYKAKRSDQPLRISIHPFDFELKLKSDLEGLLEFVKKMSQ